MATKRVVTKGKNRLLASLVSGNREPCAFCQRDTDDEAVYGKLYAIGDIQVHYFCALLSCCLVQKGKDSEGLFGFLYPDIVAEVERSKKHKCSYCNTGGASLGCSVSQCRKQFHLPCGRQRNAVSLFFGNYKSFCQQHAPRQKIPEHIMAQARIRMKKAKSALKAPRRDKSMTESIDEADASSVCVICYEPVEAYPCARSFWPPCCARDAWFHSTCLQRMALSAGVHYLKCPLCNDKEQFHSAVVGQGFYVPDRDAAWELDAGAFAGIYERARRCGARPCACPQGRAHDADTGPWDIQLCMLCGTQGVHAGCAGGAGERVCAGAGAGGRWVCAVCEACAPADITALANKIDEVIQEEQRQSRQNTRRAVVMPSRMSLRRTKATTACYTPSTSQINSTPAIDTKQPDEDSKSDTASARLDLNLKTPRRQSQPQLNNTKSTQHTVQQSPVLKTIENTLFSPTKLVEKKMKGMGMKNISSEKMVTKLKEKLKKPRPLCVKKKIVHTVLDQLLLDLLNDTQKSEILGTPIKTFNDTENMPEDNTNKEVKITKTSIELSKTGYDKEIKEDIPTKDGAGTENEVEDDSSNSTFQLPSEFIAEHHSDDSLLLFETPKKLTTVDIQKDSSLEISENNEVVNINVTKIEENSASNKSITDSKLKFAVKTDKRAFKFNPLDKETLQEDKVDIDVESFKNFYLNEVDRDFQCSFNHKHKKDCKKTKLRTAIDFAVDATKIKETRKKLKRKIGTKEGVVKKKSKTDKEIVVSCNNDTTNNIKVVCMNDGENNTESIEKSPKNRKSPKMNAKKHSDNVNETISFTVETTKTKKRLKKLKKKKHKDNIQVKIRFRKKQIRLDINTQSQSKKKKMKINKKRKLISEKKLKQWILQYTNNSSPNKVLVKPEHDVTPKKRNYVKLEKSPDALVQTSIHSFFKKVPTTD